MLKSLNRPIVDIHCNHFMQHLDHQLQDGLMAQHEFDRMRYIVRKPFELKLQIHAIEAEPALPLPVDVIGHTVALMLDLYSEGILTRSLFVYVCTHL